MTDGQDICMAVEEAYDSIMAPIMFIDTYLAHIPDGDHKQQMLGYRERLEDIAQKMLEINDELLEMEFVPETDEEDER
jgi:hypothetical protein